MKKGTYLSGLATIFCLAHADELLVFNRSKKGLSRVVSIISDAFFDKGLALNIHKCEFLPYNYTTVTPPSL